ncbi:hypothetical protein ZWY2020_032886 [Hordeum vulgare]|nr:hypothetical protein ZWY2020_032886 [Hordeum vulgare]
MRVILNIKVGLNDITMVEPKFKCSCGVPAAKRVCYAGPNDSKQFYGCGVGYVENSITDLDTDTEDPTWERHLACDTWIWADLITQFAKDVFEENQLKDADLKAALLGINISRIIEADSEIAEA